jgi:hypothetical protein
VFDIDDKIDIDKKNNSLCKIISEIQNNNQDSKNDEKLRSKIEEYVELRIKQITDSMNYDNSNSDKDEIIKMIFNNALNQINELKKDIYSKTVFTKIHEETVLTIVIIKRINE